MKFIGGSQILTRASSRVENGNAYSTAPGTTSSLVSDPSASTNLAGGSIIMILADVVCCKRRIDFKSIQNQENSEYKPSHILDTLY